jgi:hypothetical protein
MTPNGLLSADQPLHNSTSASSKRHIAEIDQASHVIQRCTGTETFALVSY